MTMIHRTPLLAALVALLALCTAAVAAPVDEGLESAKRNTNQQGYGMAGCGLGSMLFGNQNGFVQVFAGTTNGLFGTQTFGISSGTSNCVDSGSARVATRAYIEANREALAKDIARGQGETIAGLAAVAGCGDVAALGGTLQAKFGEVFPRADVSSAVVSEAVVGTLRDDPVLACRNIAG